MFSVSNGLYFLTLPLVSVMRVIYRKIRHARYLYIKRNVEKIWGARYLSKNTVIPLIQHRFESQRSDIRSPSRCPLRVALPFKHGLVELISP